MNSNWPRWIKASVNKHFKDVCDAASIYLYVEGTDRRNNDKRGWAELRMDGPEINELSKGYWQLEIVIDVLIVHHMDNEDIYTIDRMIGNVLAAFTTDIPVFKYGRGQDDDPSSQLGCLLLVPRDPKSIIVTNFGQVKVESRTLQSTIEAAYRITLP